MSATYQRPSVHVLGAIHELTQAVGAGEPIDICFNQGNPNDPVNGSPGGTANPPGLNCFPFAASA